MMRLSVRYGIITGLVISAWLIAGFSFLKLLSLNLPQATLRTLTGALGLLILFIGILYAIKTSKAKAGTKRFSYFMAFRTGLTVALIVAVIVSLASFLYVKFINPHFAEDMVKEAETSLKASGATAKETRDKLAAVRKEFSLPSQILAPLIVQTVAGVVFSFLLAFFFKSKKQS